VTVANSLLDAAVPGTPTPIPAPGPVPPPIPAPHSPLISFLTHPGPALARLGHQLSAWAGTWGLPVGAAVFAAVVLIVVIRVRWRLHRHAALADGARVITVLAPPKVTQAAAEMLWQQLMGLLRPAWKRFWFGQPHLAFEYVWSHTGVQVRLWVPGTVPPGQVEDAIAAAWPGVAVISAAAQDSSTLVLPAGAVATGGRQVLARAEVLPIRTDFDMDPLRGLLETCGRLADDEHAAVQILARPVTGRRARNAAKAVTTLRDGGSGSAGLVSKALDAITPGSTASGATTPRTGTAGMEPAEADQYRQASRKAAGSLWEVRVFYAAASTRAGVKPNDGRLRGLAGKMASTFPVFRAANYFDRKRLSAPVAVLNGRQFAGRGQLLSVPELAGLAHIPTDAAAAGLERAGAASVPPPPGIPAPDRTSGIKPIGVADTDVRKKVGLSVADARHHMHIVGATGAGKSTLMTNLVLDDVDAGRGVVVVDPKGDMVLDILARLPRRIADRTVLFDSENAACPPRLNVLQPESATDIDMVVDNVTGIFSRIFSGYWGPRTDDIFRQACLTLLHHDRTGQVNLRDVALMLTSADDRAVYTAAGRAADPVLKGFWDDFESLSDATRANHIMPLMNKLRHFLSRDIVRNSIAAGPSSFDMGDVLDGGLCLVRIPKGKLGEQTAQLLGSLVVAKCWQAASRRSGLPQHKRIDASLLLDECHNFLSLPYPMEDMLAEARGYRLSLTLAHQNLAQLPRDLREGVSANARSKVFFNVSPEDSRELERHTAPLLGAYDLSHLGKYQAAGRLVAGSEERPAFTLRTMPMRPAIAGREQEIRDGATTAFGRVPGPEVDQILALIDPR
jgi:hypothetical protein